VCILFRAHMRAPAAIPWIPRMERRAYDPTGTRLAVSHVVPGGVTGLAEALIERFWGLIHWNSLWGEFISIPKEVIGMATTCEDKS
jgi:hypothetical protein